MVKTKRAAPCAGRPLAGKRIAVTRPAAQAGRLLDGVRRMGGEPLSCPTIRLVEPADPAPLRAVVRALSGYDWVAFTSANGVNRFLDVLNGLGLEWPVGPKVAAIGPATAAAARARGVDPDLMPSVYVDEAVAEALIGHGGLKGSRVLLPRAAGARDILRQLLEAEGARVDEVATYEARPDDEGIARLRESLAREEIDMVMFTAASTVEHLVDAVGTNLGRARVAVIGPITEAAAERLGIQVDVIAEEYTADGLLRAIGAYYGRAGESE